ncbi:MAG: peptide-methionine (S)-S-oxide reductase MsrA [Clostridiales bacterium]|nr:peptide-methionine (S)-S-oxide reductase MsrA [Clostridiales bacterium]
MKAYFAGGCFWCITPIFKIYGVDKVVSGYSGGVEKNPSYEAVKKQKTGHRETIMLDYDPMVVSYDKLLEIFIDNVDPFDSEGQFIDRGHSYTLAVYYNSEEEKKAALEHIEKLKSESGKEVYISVEPFTGFYEAEEYHQDYYLKNPEEFEKEMEESGRKKHK